ISGDACGPPLAARLQLPHGFSRPFRPLRVIGLVVDALPARGREDLAGGGEGGGIHPAFRIPQAGAVDRAGALEVDLRHRDDDHRAWRLAVDGEGGAKIRIDGYLGGAIDAKRRAWSVRRVDQAVPPVLDVLSPYGRAVRRPVV